MPARRRRYENLRFLKNQMNYISPIGFVARNSRYWFDR
jgi:hypothetical protein